jgi:hypothetical protein
MNSASLRMTSEHWRTTQNELRTQLRCSEAPPNIISKRTNLRERERVCVCVCVCLGKTSTKTEEEKQHNNNKEGARSWSTKEETATGEAPTRRWCRLMQHSANRCHRCGFSKRTILASEESENVQQEEEVSETRTTHHRWCTDRQHTTHEMYLENNRNPVQAHFP